MTQMKGLKESPQLSLARRKDGNVVKMLSVEGWTNALI